MPKKNLFTWLAGIIVCSFTAITVTSCSVDDSAAYTNEEIDYKLTGKWLADLGYEYGEDIISWKLMTISTDGVININNYWGIEDTPYEEWEHICQHGVYWIDKTTKTIYMDEGDNTQSVAKYEIKDDQLIMTIKYNSEDIDEKVITLHRPTIEELDKAKEYEEKILNFDYGGKWLRTYQEDGQTVYEIWNIISLSNLYITHYTVAADGKVTKTEEVKYIRDLTIWTTDQHIYIYDINGIHNGKDYWWKVQGRYFTLGNDETKETLYTFHMITKAEYDMLNELDDKAEIKDLQKNLLGTWYNYLSDGTYTDTDSRHLITYEADGTMYYTPSINALKDLGIWEHHIKGSYTINGKVVEQQAAVAGKNILFTQQMNIKQVNDLKLESITNSETFVDGESYRVVKNLKEIKNRETTEERGDIVGTWKARLIYGTFENLEKRKEYLFEFKDDGTFTIYRQNEQGEWVAEDRILNEYFVEANMVYTRWKNADSDEMKYKGWEQLSSYADEMDWLGESTEILFVKQY